MRSYPFGVIFAQAAQDSRFKGFFIRHKRPPLDAQHTGVAARHEQQRERSLTATAVRNRIAETLALLRRAEGQTMTEYGILLALIAVAVIGVLTTMGGKIAAVFTSVTSAL